MHGFPLLRYVNNSIRKINNPSFVIIHHKKKGSYDLDTKLNHGIDDMFGHSLVKNMIDTAFEVYKEDEDSDIVYVKPRKLRMNKGGAKVRQSLPYKFNRNTMEFDLWI